MRGGRWDGANEVRAAFGSRSTGCAGSVRSRYLHIVTHIGVVIAVAPAQPVLRAAEGDPVPR